MLEKKRPIPGGIIAACATPMKDDLSADHEMLAGHCRWLLENGCSAVAPLGSTGEANSFSVMERIEILEKLVFSGIPHQKIIVGTGCCAVPDTVLLTRHALSLDVTTVLVLPPFYYKTVSEDGIFNAFEAVLEKVPDDRLQMLLYHNPGVSGVPVVSHLIKRLLHAYPGTVAGMKDSGGDWNYMKENCTRFPDFKVYAGSETYLLDILKAGGAGCISATLNINCRPASRIMECLEREEAEALQKKLSRIRSAFERYPLVAGVKCVLAKIMGNPQWLNVRPPLSRLKAKEGDRLAEKVISLMNEDSGDSE